MSYNLGCLGNWTFEGVAERFVQSFAVYCAGRGIQNVGQFRRVEGDEVGEIEDAKLEKMLSGAVVPLNGLQFEAIASYDNNFLKALGFQVAHFYVEATERVLAEERGSDRVANG